MSVQMRLGRIVNSFLTRFGYKLVLYNGTSGQTFTEGQLLKALTELRAVYHEYVFKKELTTDEESLRLLSNSMYTGFGTGLYLVAYLHQSLTLEGDICEFGVAQGVISALLAHEIKNTRKNIWLFDSFEGLPEPSAKDILLDDFGNFGSIKAYKGSLSFPEDMVRTRLSHLQFPPDRIRIVPGFIEKTMNTQDLPKTVCFAFVDMNFYEPTILALNYLDTVLSPGGFIIIDDYDFFSQGAKCAVDEFFDSRKERYSRKFPLNSSGNFCILCRLS